MALMEYAHDLKKQFTATGYTVNADSTRMLMVFHRGLQRWLPPGGHVDPDEFPGDTVIREVFEETGVRARHQGVEPLDLRLNGRTESQLPAPFSMAVQLIPESSKDVEHIHMDMMYQLIADDGADTTAMESEVEHVRWCARAEILEELATVDSVRAFARKRLSATEA